MPLLPAAPIKGSSSAQPINSATEPIKSAGFAAGPINSASLAADPIKSAGLAADAKGGDMARPNAGKVGSDGKGLDDATREPDFSATLAKPPPLSNIGLITFMRTYARSIDPNVPHGLIETWPQTIERVVRACNTQLKVGFSATEQERLFDHLYNLRGMVAGRFLWQLGTKTVDKLGLASLQNWYVSTPHTHYCHALTNGLCAALSWHWTSRCVRL
jgi:hypothetical protein